MSSGWGVLPLRIVVGLVFVVHGAQKLFGFGLAGTAGFLGSLGIPLPTVAAAALIAVELLGGLALLLGAGTRIVAAALAADMLVAILTVHVRGRILRPGRDRVRADPVRRLPRAGGARRGPVLDRRGERARELGGRGDMTCRADPALIVCLTAG
jgi:uncharacterized membrane protein YphA (DoxX/SURF4 family)